MKDPKIIDYSDMRVTLRKDFYDSFGNQLKKVEKDTEATFFAHNIIKNYRQEGHKISSFCNYETWHEIYWEKYRNQDPLEKIIHQAAQKTNFGVLSWKIGHNSSACHEERTILTKVKDGISFSFKRPENYIETLLIGWDNLDIEKLDTHYISYLSSLLKPIRDYHWAVHDKI